MLQSALMPMLIPVVGKAAKLEVIYDQNPEQEKKVSQGYEVFAKYLPEYADRVQFKPQPKSDDDFTPLLAADLYAWHFYRDYDDRQSGQEHKDSVWDALKKLPAYPSDGTVLSEDALRQMARWDALEKILKERASQTH
jgi:hypothetical protein